jgi:hypothetical protein
VAGWDVFLREVGALAEEILIHLLDKKLLGLGCPGLEAVFVEQHLLVLEPFSPGFFGDALVNFLTEVAVEGRLFEPFQFLLVACAKYSVRHSFLSADLFRVSALLLYSEWLARCS